MLSGSSGEGEPIADYVSSLPYLRHRLVHGRLAEWHRVAQEDHLPEVEVRGPRDATIGSSDSASEGAAEREAFQARPKMRPGDIIEAVLGVVATQHSGDGKANQYFLRGFNLDHGTDFSMKVDGMPVNMPTHGHGQGYADLNSLIPELVSGVRYRKGPLPRTSSGYSSDR